MHRKGALVCSACGGSLVLAAAGLLSGREATTHWTHVPVFRREFPDVQLHEDRILVQTGDGHSIVSCGGASSWQDLALGEPPMRYLARQRFEQASSQLKETADPIARIAYDVGYESEEAFNRAFRREYGTPPAAWRRENTAAVG